MREFSILKLQTEKKGYTLIEILVALAIIGVIFNFGYVGFRDFSRRQAIANAAILIQGDLRFAQENAMSGQKPEGCGVLNTLESYSFNIISGAPPSEYRIEANCGGSPVSVKDVTVPGVALASTLNPLNFKVLGQGTNIQDGGVALVTLTQTGTNNTATVTVSSEGVITVGGTTTVTPTSTPVPTPTVVPTSTPYCGPPGSECRGDPDCCPGSECSGYGFCMAPPTPSAPPSGCMGVCEVTQECNWIGGEVCLPDPNNPGYYCCMIP